ncbi:hypothetical protein [Nonlabens agnitus]|uniref:ParB/Sulfiredoxin domain-containing protein n=1 Tax=Nonlabens agnitus TaxID=870484 RepID=A0A2S9WQU5_9FLAO|nr:hypothetical protein [Nonlabens agnitus]PRP65843.1 hypothetical protein BST86_01420 [Nonlabens agnitus]
MELSEEEIQKFWEEKLANEAYFRRLSADEVEYKKKDKSFFTNLNIQWCTEVSEIDTAFLFEDRKFTLLDADIFFDAYTIVNINIDRVLNFLFDDASFIERRYSKTKLWDQTDRENYKYTKLLNYINDGQALCPPILSYRKNEFSDGKLVFSIIDGNHRTAFSRYIGLQEINFLIHKNDWKNLKLHLE